MIHWQYSIFLIINWKICTISGFIFYIFFIPINFWWMDAFINEMIFKELDDNRKNLIEKGRKWRDPDMTCLSDNTFTFRIKPFTHSTIPLSIMNFIKQEINRRRIENNKKIQHNICDRRTKGIPIAGVPPILTLIAFTLLLYNVKHQL